MQKSNNHDHASLSPHNMHIADINVMRNEIAMLGAIITKGCMNDKSERKEKKPKNKSPKYINKRHPLIKNGLARKREVK
jgi:hypothetical protein